MVVVRVDLKEISLAWTVGFDGYSPIHNIEVAVISEGVYVSVKRFEGTETMGTISNLIPHNSYTFSVAVVNTIGTSDRMNITTTTSESLCIIIIAVINPRNCSCYSLLYGTYIPHPQKIYHV